MRSRGGARSTSSSRVPSVRFPDGGGGGDDEESGPTRSGKNPPGGVLVSATGSKEKPGEKEILTVEILEGDRVLRTYTSEKKDQDEEAGDRAARARIRDGADKPIEPKAGLNRLVWDMRIVKPSLLPKAIIWGNDQGPQGRARNLRRPCEARRGRR